MEFEKYAEDKLDEVLRRIHSKPTGPAGGKRRRRESGTRSTQQPPLPQPHNVIVNLVAPIGVLPAQPASSPPAPRTHSLALLAAGFLGSALLVGAIVLAILLARII